jgi:hypothetical protein
MIARVAGALTLTLVVSSGCGGAAPQDSQPSHAETGSGSASGSTTPTAAGNRTTAAASSGVFINEHELSREAVAQLVAIYHRAPTPGHFWYDTNNGLYGMWGREAAGYIRAGHDFGPLPENASNGHTGVFMNGRQLNNVEVTFLQILFNGQVRQGHATVDAYWNVYDERGVLLTNLALALQQAQRAMSGGGGRPWAWRDGSGAAMASDGGCTMMAVPGAPVYGTSGC